MFATLIVSQPVFTDKVRHTVIANLDGIRLTLTRTTNGKQGRGNAWVIGTPEHAEVEQDVLLDIVSVPTTSRDALDYNTKGMPSTLLTKLVHSIQITRDETVNVADLINECINDALSNPEAMGMWVRDQKRAVSVATSLSAAPEPVLGFVPSVESMAHYQERSWHGITETVMYRWCKEHKVNIMLEGPAGSGKTSSGQAFAAREGMFYTSVPSNQQIDLSQLIGGFMPYGDGRQFHWVDGSITRAVRFGGYLNLGEINMMPANLSSRLHSLLDYRRTLIIPENNNEVIEAHPDLIIVADYNPNYRGTRLMNEAFKDRFEMKLIFDYDSNIERGILKSESLIDLGKRMRKASNLSFAAPASSGNVAFDTPISTRILKTFEAIATTLSYDLAVDVFVNNFNDDERVSVRNLLEGMEYNLKSELGLTLVGQTLNEEE
jgi:nitric oxide reductase NorQ protein